MLIKSSPGSYINLDQLSNNEYKHVKATRWKARTNLKYLCNHVLNYPDVQEHIHRPVLDLLQKFPTPELVHFKENDIVINGKWKYKPILEPKPGQAVSLELPGYRRVLLIDSRGFLKTTINATAHTIQWILNYPNIAMQIIQSNIEKAESIIGEIKKHFQYNPNFRNLFPEHCPNKRIADWGTKGQFITEARDVSVTRKESTVMAAGIDKGSAGYHFDVMKFSDIVEPSNTRTIAGCKDVIKSFHLMENLLVSPIYWIDVEGTRYHFSDLYGKIIDDEDKLSEETKRWKIFVRGCYKKKVPYEKQKFIPSEVDSSVPFLLDEKGKPISWWPERYPTEALEHDKLVKPYEFATQQLNNPLPAEEGMQPFPVNDSYPKIISRENFVQNIHVNHYDISIDTAETDNQRSNYSSIAVGAWSQSNKCYVVEIIHGKFLPNVLMDKIIYAVKKYNPQSVKIEKTSFVRGFIVGLSSEMERQNIYVPIEQIQRDNQVSKQERILNTLQPWYISGNLRFLNDLSCMKELKLELSRFPNYEYDDILDSIADLFQNKTFFGREVQRRQFIANEKAYAEQLEEKYQWDKFLKIEDPYSQVGDNYTINEFYNRTGGL